MDQKGQYLAHNDQKYIGPNLDFFLLKILIFWRGSKSFSTNISENQLGTFFQLFCFVVHSTTMDQKGKYLAQNDQKNNFWSNLAVSRPKIPIFKEGSKTFGTLISGNPLKTCFVLKILTGEFKIFVFKS